LATCFNTVCQAFGATFWKTKHPTIRAAVQETIQSTELAAEHTTNKRARQWSSVSCSFFISCSFITTFVGAYFTAHYVAHLSAFQHANQTTVLSTKLPTNNSAVCTAFKTTFLSTNVSAVKPTYFPAFVSAE
jgi:hypothetical protein